MRGGKQGVLEMIKYFKYELKKNFWTFIVLTVIVVALYQVVLFNSTLFYSYTPEGEGTRAFWNESSQIGVVYVLVGIFAAVTPVLTYSFKMNKRSVDEFYSLPIKREKIYLVKTLVGLFLTLAPYTIAYWSGFLHVVCRENYFSLGYYVPGYFGGILFGICLYGINAFAFTRANRTADGVIFILAYTFIGWLAVGFLNSAFPLAGLYRISDNFITFGGLVHFGNNIDALLRGKIIRPYSDWQISAFLYPVLLAAVSYLLLFFLVRFEKGERAEQNSDSPFGYRTLIPLYTILLLGISRFEWILVCLIIIGTIVMTIIYKRKILFGWKQWAVIIASILFGLLLCGLAQV